MKIEALAQSSFEPRQQPINPVPQEPDEVPSVRSFGRTDS
jgi:hypothetical protein